MEKSSRLTKLRVGENQWVPRCGREITKLPKAITVLDRRNPQSQFYKSIHISYPDANDRARARKMGVSAGGNVYVHGLPDGYKWVGAGLRLKD
jgi:murein L,D-transpeptidase YafK